MNITGKYLIELGYEPASWFGEALATLQGCSDEDEVRFVCDTLVESCKVYTIPLHESPVPYKVYADATNEDEAANLMAATNAMDNIMVTPTIIGGALMPDTCPVGGNNIPVGGVAITEGTIHPEMHSSDVCCSVATSVFQEGHYDTSEILDVAMSVTHFGPGGRKRMQYGLEDDPLYNRILNNYFTKDYVEKAVSHMATQGDGNHFLFIGRSHNTGRIQVVTHHGSRGFGASVYKKGLHEAKQNCKKICPETTNPWLDYDSDIGKEYWEALQIIKAWTHLNHNVIHNRLLNKLCIGRDDFYWNEHNFVFKDGNRFYHAKGSTPMDPKFNVGETPYEHRRLIPLNMSQPVLVVVPTEENELGFAPHGAGRNLSRAEFFRRNGGKSFDKEVEGLDIRFYSGTEDHSEFPSAYKNADEVVRQIEEYKLASVVDRINPLGCIMGGKFNTPWKKVKINLVL